VSTISEIFLAACTEPERAKKLAPQALEVALTTVLADAHEAWPQVALDDADFVRYLAERTPVSPSLLATLAQLFTNDLYIAAAAVAGNKNGLQAFNQAYRPAVVRAAARVEKQGVQADDTCQQLMEHLLLPRGERPPGLALYSGQGPLMAYVRVASLRRALRILAKENKLPDAGGLDRVMELADTSDNPELAVLKNKYRAEFKAAFQKALSALPSAERNLLRYHYLTELNTRQIGRLLGLNQSNVVRRLASVRATLLDQTRAILMETLGLGESKFQSIMMLVQSQLDVSIERMLQSQKDDE
jgi:RNA polymerase sigma-70 factor (ECF subfamily)